MPVKNRFAELHDQITEWRRDMHQHPELMFDTHRTSALVEEKLKAFGCDEVVTGVGRTGVVGVIKGKSTGSGRVIGLRADMDALPIHEETGVDYASKVPMARCTLAAMTGTPRCCWAPRNTWPRPAISMAPAW